MEIIPTTEEIFKKYANLAQFEEGEAEYLIDEEDFITAMIEFAKLHVKAALKQAAHESQCYNKAKFPGDENWTVDIDSILNSYPLDKIK